MTSKNLPLVSVIVNCHNGQKFLKKCIKAPVKNTKAKTSNAAATINAKLAIAGDSNPAEAKNF